MEYHWLLPPQGVVKINVHGATPFIPFMNGNINGIGMVSRNSDGELLKLSTGVISNLSPLDNQLRAILHGMKRAFEDDHRDVIIETDSHEAFLVLKNFPFDVPLEVASTAKQIMTRLHDPRWACSIVYVFAERNMLATYLARIGGEKCSHLYTFSRPIGRVEELLSLDLGFGPIAPQDQDIEIYEDEPDPVNFGVASINAVMHGGLAFHEDFFAVDNEGTPEVVDIHNFMEEDFVYGNGYAEGFVGDHPMNVMY